MSKTHLKSKHGSPPGTPRWVKLVWVLVIILTLMAGIGQFQGNRDSSSHMMAPPAIIVDYGVQ